MRLAPRLRKAVATGPERCAADWRRPDGYWRCSRPAGHRGRHKLRATVREQAQVGLRELNRREATRRAADGGDGLVAG
ncbi:MAG: hypothetical protein M0004_09445 [Actinomycetota bacterium]|nr:hypothetical protein [Actinomycetota bacterium]